MDVERAECRRPANGVLGHALRGREGQLVGTPNLERREGKAPVERRADQRLPGRRGSRACRSATTRVVQSVLAARRRPGFGPNRRCAGGRSRFHPRRRSHRNQNAGHRSEFGVQRGGDVPEVVGIDPAFQKARRHRKPRLPALDRLQLYAAEPAIVDVLAQFHPQPVGAAAPRFRKRLPARIPALNGYGIGFVVHVHGRGSAAGAKGKR